MYSDTGRRRPRFGTHRRVPCITKRDAMRTRRLLLVLAAVAVSVAIADAFSCDARDAPTDRALSSSDSAFRQLSKDGWRRETGQLRFTHDVNDDNDISEYGYPGAMLYARAEFLGGVSPVFRLGPSDALVITLCTPPPTRYFGFSTYVWRRQSRVVSATCANNPLNSRTMRGGYPAFDQPTVLVSTGDLATFDAVSTAFLAAGVPVTALNLEQLAVDRVSFGRSILDRADDLTFSFRVYDANAREYAKQTWTSVMLLRSPRGGGRSLQPLVAITATPPSPKRGIPVNELRLEMAASFLQTSVKNKVIAAGFRVTTRASSMAPVDVDRDKCLATGNYSPFRVGGARDVNIQSGCFGETRDCTYTMSPESIAGDKPFLALFTGADSVKLGNAAFANLAAYHTGGALSLVSAAAVRVAAFADHRMWRREDENNLFAHAFASPGLCRVFDDDPDVSCVEVAPAPFNDLFFIGRAYLDPSTGTAPNAEELLPVTVTYFAPE